MRVNDPGDRGSIIEAAFSMGNPARKQRDCFAKVICACMKRILLAIALCMSVANPSFGVPGDGVRVGPVVLSPFVELSGTFDDNVFLERDGAEDDDFYWQITPGIAFLRETDHILLQGRAWGQFQRYKEFEQKDNDSFGERVGLTYESDKKTLMRLEQKYTRIEDYENYPRSVDAVNIESQDLGLTEDRTERLLRYLFDVGGTVGRWIGDRTYIEGGLAYGFVDYDSAALFDWDETKAQIEGRLKVSRKTEVLLTAQYSVQDADGLTDDLVYYLGRIGVFKRVTGKTAVKAGVGFESYETDDRALSGQSLDGSIVNFDLAATWDVNPRTQIQFSGRNGIQPTTQYERNTKEVLLLAAGVTYKLTDTILLSLAGTHRADDYTARVPVSGGFFDKERELYGIRGRIDYAPHAKFFELFLEGTYEEVEDNLNDDYEDYDQMRISGGIFVRY